jgi:hypothetical protein
VSLSQGNCEDCTAVFEFYSFAMVWPKKCRTCQRKEAGIREYVPKPKKEKIAKIKEALKVIEEVKIPEKINIPEEKSVNGIDVETLVYKYIPGVSAKLLSKYKDVRKLTNRLKKT